jgi:hypothetical protein
LRKKAWNGRGQKRIGRWLRCSEPQCTGRLAAELIGRFQRRLILVERRQIDLLIWMILFMIGGMVLFSIGELIHSLWR